jgi:hypothetical protein
MPTQATLTERLVKRVENAIRNPMSSARDVKDAIKDLKESHISIYREDYDEWMKLAIHIGSERKLVALFNNRSKTTFTDTALNSIIEQSPHMIPRYVASRLFNPESLQNDNVIRYLINRHVADGPNTIPAINLFFAQPKTAAMLLRYFEGGWFTKKQRSIYINKNPVLYKRKQQRKILLRFWIGTVKKNLGDWRESLYIPGSGTLYKKALTSFNQSYIEQSS